MHSRHRCIDARSPAQPRHQPCPCPQIASTAPARMCAPARGPPHPCTRPLWRTMLTMLTWPHCCAGTMRAQATVIEKLTAPPLGAAPKLHEVMQLQRHGAGAPVGGSDSPLANPYWAPQSALCAGVAGGPGAHGWVPARRPNVAGARDRGEGITFRQFARFSFAEEAVAAAMEVHTLGQDAQGLAADGGRRAGPDTPAASHADGAGAADGQDHLMHTTKYACHARAPPEPTHACAHRPARLATGSTRSHACPRFTRDGGPLPRWGQRGHHDDNTASLPLPWPRALASIRSTFGQSI